MALYCGITDLDKRVEEVSAVLLVWVQISLRDRQDTPATGRPQQAMERLHGRLERRMSAVGCPLRL